MRPNIVYIHTHDTGKYISPYGYAAATPHLMDLARDGLLFRQAFSAAPTCSPSRAALMTGMAPHSSGMIGLAHLGFRIKDKRAHLASYLRNHGFHTVLCGIQHEDVDPKELGYEDVLTAESAGSAHIDLANAAKVAEFLKQPAAAPFFLSFGLISTHRPFPTDAPDIDPDYVIPPFPLADSPMNRADMAGYLQSVKIVDDAVGIVMEALKRSGKEGRTIIIFSTDHGIAFPGMKCRLYDTGIGVSLLMKFPEPFEQQHVTDALVSQIDLFPTLCDYLQLEQPAGLQGRSLLPILRGETKQVREAIFAEVTFHAAYEPMRCIRTERYKLIRLYEDGDVLPVNMDDGPSKAFLMEHGLPAHIPSEREMLFDLYLDPVERVNLIHHPGCQSVYSELSRQLDRHMQDTGDPLLAGKVMKPAGAIVHKRSAISPKLLDLE